MKVNEDPSMPGAYSEWQVVVYPPDWEDPRPGNMEEIICIVNEQATGSKRERDEVTAESPCAKRSCRVGFSCSTPSSASTHTLANQLSDLPAWHLLRENPQQEELDDSLLELSDNDVDSIGSMTDDQMATYLEFNDDDLCYAAEPLGDYVNVATHVAISLPESENGGENGGASPFKTLNTSDTLTEEPENEGDLSNYAAMPPSPCQSTINPVEVITPKQSSVSNVESSHKFLTAKTVMENDLQTPLPDIKEGPASQLPRSGSPTLLRQSTSLSRVDAAVDSRENLDFAFDCDIDNLLAISPRTVSSSEEDNCVESAAITAKGNSCIISDSILPPQNIESDQVLAANAAFSSTSDAAQYVPPLSLNTAGLPKVHHHSIEPEPSRTSSIVTAEPKLIIESSGIDQNVECQKPSKAEETKGMLNAKSHERPTDPSPNSNRSKTMAATACKVQGSLGQEKEKPLNAVAALPRTSFRAAMSDFEMKRKKNLYCDQVSMHIDGQRQCNVEEPLSELASLLNKTSRENQNWMHPSDFTKRNHPRFGKKPSKRCTLRQWMESNGGSNERFKDFPDTFQRSPIPGALPLSS